MGRQSLHTSRGRVTPAVATALAATFFILAGCGEGTVGGASLELEGTFVHLPSPALEGSGEPNLFVAEDGRVYMSWFDRLPEGGHALRFASLHPRGGGPEDAHREAGDGSEHWSEPRTIVSGDNFFVNWADFPSMHALPGDILAAHWPARSGPNTYDYDVHVGWSRDGGESWSEPMVPHRDETRTEHGFVSLFPWEDGSLAAVWLDGREFAFRPESPEMTLRFTTLTPDGVGEELLLDARVCDCCQTSAALTDEGPVVVYRDRTEDEIRDISIVRHGPDGWSEPVPVHRDGWEIPACPVNGPMVAARGNEVAVAWFTAANDEPRVWVAFSGNAGRSFDTPIRIDGGNPVGRVAVVMEPDGRAVVSWLERVGDGAEVRVRRVTPDGSRSAARTVASSSAARASGFPRMVRSGDALVFAWRDVDQANRIEVSVLYPGDPEGR